MARRSFISAARQAIVRAIAPDIVRSFENLRRERSRERFGSYREETGITQARTQSASRKFAESNAYFDAAIRALVTNLVGAGIVPASTHPDIDVQALLAARWAAFSTICDFDGLTNAGGLQAGFVRDMIRDGEGLGLLKNTAAGLRIQRLPSELLDSSKTADLGSGAHITNGVEFDSSGAKVALWILPVAPSNTFGTGAQSIRVPAEDVIHLYEPRGAGQVRGLPWGATAIDRIREVDELEDGLLIGCKISAAHAGFIQDELGSSGLPLEGTQDGAQSTVSLEPGVIRRLGPGEKITFNAPAQATQGVEFLASQIRAVASSFGVPPQLIDSDYSRANFSSLRSSYGAYAARLDAITHTILVPQLLNKIWRRWLTTEILRGAIAAKDFESNAEEWLGVEWYPPAPPQADDLKAAQADALQIKEGLKSRAQAIRERGYAPEAVDAERAADAEREQALGLGAAAQDENAPEDDSNGK